MLKNYRNIYQRRILTTIILTGVLLYTSNGFTLIKSAIAAPKPVVTEIAQDFLTPNISTNILPTEVENAVLEDLSQRTGIAIAQLNIVEYSQQAWPDSCLGLALPGTFCAQVIVFGWRVVVSDGTQEWVYRTDNTGRQIALENSNRLPTEVKNAVLEDLSQRTGIAIAQLNIVEYSPIDWPDSCLGLALPDTACAQVIVPGWRVVVSDGTQEWVYRTNASGSNLGLETAIYEVEGTV